MHKLVAIITTVFMNMCLLCSVSANFPLSWELLVIDSVL
jgi:hypothetical protein